MAQDSPSFGSTDDPGKPHADAAPDLLRVITEEIIGAIVQRATQEHTPASSVAPSESDETGSDIVARQVLERESTPGVSSNSDGRDLVERPEASLKMLNKFLVGLSAACCGSKQSLDSSQKLRESNLEPKVVHLIQQQVRRVLDDELATRLPSAPTSPQNPLSERSPEDQVLELLRLRDTEIRNLQKSETAQNVIIGSKNSEIEMQAQKIASLEQELKQMAEEVTEMRFQEQKTTMQIDLHTVRIQEMQSKCDEEHRLRIDAGDIAERKIGRIKEEQKIEIDAYRRALATEESRSNTLQKEVRLLEQAQSLLTGDKCNRSNPPRKKHYKPKPKTLPQLEDIYAPLSVQASLPRLDSVPKFALLNDPFRSYLGR